MYVKVKELPDTIRAVLHSISYANADINIVVREKASVFCGGSQGRRAFAIVFNLATGEVHKHLQGSWGGSNMFNPGNQVDNDYDGKYTIPENGAVLLGSEGYGGVRADITISPANAAKLLPEKASLGERERSILNTFGYKSGYRQEEWRRMNVTPAELGALAERGLLKCNKAGAWSITTEGKNAR